MLFASSEQQFNRLTVLVIASIFLFNSLSYAYPLYDSALRAKSAALSIALDMADSFEESERPVVFHAKTSSAGVEVLVKEITEIFGCASITEKQAMSAILEKGMGSSSPYLNLLSVIGLAAIGDIDGDAFSGHIDTTLQVVKRSFKKSKKHNKLLAAMNLVFLSSINQNILYENKNAMLSVLKRNLKSGDKLLSAIGLAALCTMDNDILHKYKDIICPILEENLSNDYKLWSSIGLAFLCSADDEILFKHKDDVLDLFRASLIGDNRHDKLLAMIGFAAIKKKETSLCKISIDYHGLNKPYTILANSTRELSSSLSHDVLLRLGISCVYVSDAKVVFLAVIDGKQLKRVVDITVEGELGNALEFFISNKIDDAAGFSKSSSSGVSDEPVAYDTLSRSSWYKELNSYLADMAGVYPGEHILEIGAGSGASTTVLLDKLNSNGKVIAIEPNSQYLDIAKEALKKEPVEFILGNAPEANGAISDEFLPADKAFLFNAIHLLSRHEAFFSNLSALIKPGGILAFSTTYFKENRSEFRRMQRRIYIKFLRNAKARGRDIVTRDRARFKIRPIMDYEEASRAAGFEIVTLEHRMVKIPFSGVENFYRDKSVTDYIAPLLTMKKREELIMGPVMDEINIMRNEGKQYIEGEWLYVVAKNKVRSAISAELKFPQPKTLVKNQKHLQAISQAA